MEHQQWISVVTQPKPCNLCLERESYRSAHPCIPEGLNEGTPPSTFEVYLWMSQNLKATLRSIVSVRWNRSSGGQLQLWSSSPPRRRLVVLIAAAAGGALSSMSSVGLTSGDWRPWHSIHIIVIHARWTKTDKDRQRWTTSITLVRVRTLLVKYGASTSQKLCRQYAISICTVRYLTTKCTLIQFIRIKVISHNNSVLIHKDPPI